MSNQEWFKVILLGEEDKKRLRIWKRMGYGRVTISASIRPTDRMKDRVLKGLTK